MGNSRSIACECELPSPLPQLQHTNFKMTVMAKVSPDPSCKNGARAFPSCIPETWKWCKRGSLSSVGILTLGIGEWVHVTLRGSIYHSIHRTIPGAQRAHLNARYRASLKPTKTKKRSIKRAEEMFSRSAMAAPIIHLLPMEIKNGQSKQTVRKWEQVLSWVCYAFFHHHFLSVF